MFRKAYSNGFSDFASDIGPEKLGQFSDKSYTFGGL